LGECIFILANQFADSAREQSIRRVPFRRPKRLKSVLLPIIVGLVFQTPTQPTASPQEIYSLVRTYKVGDADRYESIIEIEGQYSAVVRSTVLMTVKKVYSNGDADIETRAEKSTAVVMGQATQVPLPKPSTSRYDKIGMEYKSTRGIGGMPNFMRFVQLAGKQGLKVGESVDVTDKSDDATVNGKFTLVAVKEQVANIRGDLTVQAKTQANPYTLQVESFVSVTDGKPLVTSGIVKGLVSDPRAPRVDQIRFTVSRLSPAQKL
jgi:hypothetical protein